MKIQGTLIPIGGNENKGIRANEKYTLEYIEQSILSRVVRESGGNESFFVIIPTASSIPKEVGEIYLEAFKKLKCSNIKILDIREKRQCEEPENIAIIEKADCVLFSGGDQSKIVKEIGGTSIHNILLHRYQNENFVLAGTSAGAMAMSEEMIAGSNPKRLFTKGALKMNMGMAIIDHIIFDSHFIKRRRFARLASAVAKFPDLIGIGLDEDTGLVIKDGNECEIIGTGMVILFDARKLTYNTSEQVKEGCFISLSNLITHILTLGDYFNIEKNLIRIAPVYEGTTSSQSL